MSKRRILCFGKNSKIYNLISEDLPNHESFTHDEISLSKANSNDISIIFFKSNNHNDDIKLIKKLSHTFIIYLGSIASRLHNYNYFEFKYCKYKKEIELFLKKTPRSFIINLGIIKELADLNKYPNTYMPITRKCFITDAITNHISKIEKNNCKNLNFKTKDCFLLEKHNQNNNKLLFSQIVYIKSILDGKKFLSIFLSIYIRLFKKRISGYTLLLIGCSNEKIQVGNGAFGKANLKNPNTGSCLVLYSPFKIEKFSVKNRDLFQLIGRGMHGLDRIRYGVKMIKSKYKKNYFIKTRSHLYKYTLFKDFFNFNKLPLHVIDIKNNENIWHIRSINKDGVDIPLFCRELILASGAIQNSCFLLDLDKNIKDITLSDHELLYIGPLKNNKNSSKLIKKIFFGIFFKNLYSKSLYTEKTKTGCLYEIRPYSPIRFKKQNPSIFKNSFIDKIFTYFLRINEYIYNMFGISLNTPLMIQAQILHKDCVKIKNKISRSKINLIKKDLSHSYNKISTRDVINSISFIFKTKFKYNSTYPSHHIYGFDNKILKSITIKSLIKEHRLKIIGAPIGKNLTITHHTLDEMKRIENNNFD